MHSGHMVPELQIKEKNSCHFLNRFIDVCNFSTLTVDGIFASATENAVKKVQQYCNVTADGVVGSNTRNAIAANLPA